MLPTWTKQENSPIFLNDADIQNVADCHQNAHWVWVTPCLVGAQLPKGCYSTCHIECLRSMHRALNIDEKKLIAQFGGKLRDERFEPN